MSDAPKILVADDHELNRRLIERLLKPAGYQILHAANGKEAFELAIEHEPSLILMDIRMPVMDGLEAIRVLRQHERTMGIPVIVLTAYSTPEQLAPVHAAGFDAVITKPINVDALLTLVRQFVPLAQ